MQQTHIYEKKKYFKNLIVKFKTNLKIILGLPNVCATIIIHFHFARPIN